MKKLKLILQSTVMVLSGVTSMAGAVDIVVSGEAGVVWEGLPWSASGSQQGYFWGANNSLYYSWAPIFLSPRQSGGCSDYNSNSDAYKTINGVLGYRITDHLILVPIASGSVSYTDYYRKTQVINWRSDTNGFYWNMPYDNNKEHKTPENNYIWCAAAFPSQNPDNEKDKIFDPFTYFKFNGQGHWVIYADGKQTTARSSVRPFYFNSVAAHFGNQTQILPTNFNVRVTTLKCTVNTPQSIDFGTVANSSKTPRTVAGEVSVVCAQGSVPESLEVSLLARPAGGSVLPTDTTVGVQIGGETVGTVRGFIGERANEEAGCIDRPSSLSLNYLNQYKLGGITQSESAKNFTQPLVWTFCPVPNSKTGRATAAIELNATFK